MTEIDDEMVDRAEASFVRNFRDPKIAFTTMDVRGLLEAALSPKPEPEIEVTEGMREAGVAAWRQWVEKGPSNGQNGPEMVYRAMVKAAPDGAKPAPQGVSSAAPVKETGGGVLGTLHARKGEKKAHQHRRKDDTTYVSFFSLDRA